MKRFTATLLIILFSLGCKSFDNVISQDSQCVLVRSGVSTSITLLLNKKSKKIEKDDEKKLFFERNNKIRKILEEKILPKIKGLEKPLKRDEWIELLSLLDDHLDTEEKVIIKQQILSIFASTDIPKKRDSEISDRAMKLLYCLFSGILDAFTVFSKDKNFKKLMKLHKSVDKTCLECE